MTFPKKHLLFSAVILVAGSVLADTEVLSALNENSARTLLTEEPDNLQSDEGEQAHLDLLAEITTNTGFKKLTAVDTYEKRFQSFAPRMNDVMFSETQRTKLWAHFMLSWLTMIVADEESGEEKLQTIADMKSKDAEDSDPHTAHTHYHNPLLNYGYGKHADTISAAVIHRLDRLKRLLAYPWSNCFTWTKEEGSSKKKYVLPAAIEEVIDSFLKSYHAAILMPMTRCIQGAMKHRANVCSTFSFLLSRLEKLAAA